jgi:hypothetical protein
MTLDRFENLPAIVLEATDRPGAVADRGSETLTVRGSAARLAQWATGRGGSGLELPNGEMAPAARHWL